MKKVDLSGKWMFTKEQLTKQNFNNISWEEVTIPHTWNGIDGQDGGNDYYRGKCWYYRTFEVEETNDRIFIEFEGVNSVATVTVNGSLIGEHKGGYSLFRFDITNLVNDGTNLLVVSADNTHYPDIYPLLADFTFYGGIYRDVHLVYTNNTSFDLTDDGTLGIYVSQVNVSNELAILEIKSLIKNYSNIVAATVNITFIDFDGNIIVQKNETFDIDKNYESNLILKINNPHLWNSIEDPYLYNLIIELFVSDKLVDKRIIKTGLRYFEFDETYFYLNGKQMFLNGVCRHQDRSKIGNALTKEMHDEDMRLIKEIGANSLRLAHYQQADYFYDLCDKEGMVTWAEIPYITIPSKTDLKGTNALSQLKELIKQNYNHSSIIMWGVQNEITAAGKRDNLENIVQKLHKLAKKLDPYRVTTQAQIASQPKKDSLNEITDVLGFNQYFGWYFGEVKDLKEWLTTYRELNPRYPLCISEYGVEGIIKYHTNTPKTKDYTEEYHAWWHEATYEILEKTDFVWGTYVWNMFSFAADARDEGGVKGLNNKGLITIDRKTKKDAFYFYKAKWSKEPVLHLNSKRFVKRYEKNIILKAYSNLGEVQFYLNDELIKIVKSEDVIFTAKMILKEGVNKIKVISKDLIDTTTVMTVNKINSEYIVPPKKHREGLLALSEEHNWIDSQVDNDEEIIIDSKYFSSDDIIIDILANEDATKVLRKYLRPLFENELFDVVQKYSIMKIHNLDKNAIPLGLVVKINKELQKVMK